jgi:hypothetical protein
VHVVPATVAAQVGRVLDPALFDVTALKAAMKECQDRPTAANVPAGHSQGVSRGSATP